MPLRVQKIPSVSVPLVFDMASCCNLIFSCLATAYAKAGQFDDARRSMLTSADGSAAIAKPYMVEDVAHALAIVREMMTLGTATPPFPPGFRVLPAPALSPAHVA